MGLEVEDNIRSARKLYENIIEANLSNGCLHVVLQAFGAECTIADILQHDFDITEWQYVFDYIQRKGFSFNWFVGLDEGITAQEVRDYLDDNYNDLLAARHLNNLAGELAGYVGLLTYPGEKDSHHAIGILPRNHLSKSRRKRLKQENAYLLIDTRSGGIIKVKSKDLAQYINHLIAANVHVALLQLWR